MNDDNKKNLYRLISLFTSVLVFFLATVTAVVSFRFWWASLPTSGIAIAGAILLFKFGFVDPDKYD